MQTIPPPTNGINWVLLLQVAVPAAFGGLIGALVGAWLTSRREEAARRFAFVEKQVIHFYSPLAGIRREIRAKSELRARIELEEDAAWRDLIRDMPPAQIEVIRRQRMDEFVASIPYNNQQLRDELLPGYRKMLEIFKDHYWLAAQSTKAYYTALSEYVEIWNRWIAGAIPGEVVQRLEHGERRLQPLYEDLEHVLQQLRSRLSGGRA